MGTDNGTCWHGFSQERGPRTPGPGPPDAAAGRDPGRWRPAARRGHLAPARDPGVTCSRTSPRGGHRALGSSGGRDSPSGAGRRLRAQACSPGEAPARQFSVARRAPKGRRGSAPRCACFRRPAYTLQSAAAAQSIRQRNSGRPGPPSGVVLLRGRSGEGGSRQAQRGAQSVCAERPVPGEVPETSHSSTDTPRRPVFWSSPARLHTAVTASVPPSLTDWPDGHHDPGRKASQATSTPGTCHGRAGCSQDPPADATRSPVTLRRGGF